MKWITVIDLDGDLKYLKYVHHRGNGPNRVHQYDEIFFKYNIFCDKEKVESFETEENSPLKIELSTINGMHNIIWKMLSSMKTSESSSVKISN